MSSLRVTSLKGRTSGVSPTLPDGAVVTGVTTSTTFDGNLTGDVTGSGANITDLNATQLTSGTVPDARFPATLPAVDGSALTNLNIPAGFTELDAALFN
tara:strand:- start:54 stop:350 length:297 start_codon:yes stop_codon:yes gene_type:complete